MVRTTATAAGNSLPSIDDLLERAKGGKEGFVEAALGKVLRKKFSVDGMKDLLRSTGIARSLQEADSYLRAFNAVWQPTANGRYLAITRGQRMGFEPEYFISIEVGMYQK